MKRYLYKALLVAIAFGCVSTETSAQLVIPQQDSGSARSFPSLRIGGQARYRGELDGRFFDLAAKPLFINLLRTQISFAVELSADMTAHFQIQDSRNFGEESDAAWRGTLDGRGDNFDMRRAYLEWRNFLVPGLNLTLGRQGFFTNNERLIGNLDWHNVGRAYDGATLTYAATDGVQARAFAFVLGNDELLMTSAERQNPQALMGIDVSVPWQQALNLYLYHDRAERKVRPFGFTVMGDTLNVERYTTGLYGKNTVNDWEYEFEGAYQFGKKIDGSQAGTSIRIASWQLAGYAAKRFSIGTTGKATIGVGIEAYSGNNTASVAEDEGFNHLTTTIHKFYGLMDFLPFTVLPSPGLRRAPDATNYGLIGLYTRATFAPNTTTDMTLTAHYFLTQTPKILSQSLEAREIGMEIDAVITHKITLLCSAQFGASLFAPGAILRATNATRNLGGDIAYWAYTMLTVNF